MQLRFRPVRASDHDWLFALHKAAHRELVEAVYQPWDDHEQREVFFAPLVTDFAVSVIERAGCPVGAVYLGLRDADCWLELLEVSPDQQGQGIGTHALAWVTGHAAGGRATRLQVHRRNARARTLYERAGFTVVAETPKHHMMRCPSPVAAR